MAKPSNSLPPSKPVTDADAETAIRDAMGGLAQAGTRSYAHNVPTLAQKYLVAAGAGRITDAEATKRVRSELDAMVSRGDLEAHLEPHKDWKLLN